jgi:hypothetical protein
MPAAQARARDLTWPLMATLAAAAAVVPLWCSELLPFQDAPQHLAAIRVLADHRDPALGFERWFEIDLRRLQYLGFYLPAAALAKLVGPDAACRLLLSAVALALPAAFSIFLGALGRDRRLAVLAPAVFHTAPLYLGFFNFVASVPPAIAVAGAIELELRAPSKRRALLAALGGALLLWMHPSALAFALAASAVLALTSGQPLRRMARSLAPLVPAGALLAAWAVNAAATRDAGQPASSPRWLPWSERALDVLRFGNVLAGHADEVAVAALAAVFAMLVVVPGRAPERWWRVPLLLGLSLAACMLSPYQVGYVGFIGLRALPFVALLAIAAPPIAGGRAAGALLAAAVAVQALWAGALVRAYRAFDREAQPAALLQVLTEVPPGSRLVAFIPRGASAVIQFQPYLHFGAYAQVQRGGRVRYNFAEQPWTPVRFRRGSEPWPSPRGWETSGVPPDPRAYDGEDYALVKDGQAPPPAPFALAARAGRWSLYARR